MCLLLMQAELCKLGNLLYMCIMQEGRSGCCIPDMQVALYVTQCLIRKKHCRGFFFSFVYVILNKLYCVNTESHHWCTIFFLSLVKDFIDCRLSKIFYSIFYERCFSQNSQALNLGTSVWKRSGFTTH